MGLNKYNSVKIFSKKSRHLTIWRCEMETPKYAELKFRVFLYDEVSIDKCLLTFRKRLFLPPSLSKCL